MSRCSNCNTTDLKSVDTPSCTTNVVKRSILATKANYSSLTVSTLMANNITASSLNVQGDISINKDLCVNGDLFVNGAVTSINVKRINNLIENISTSSIHVSGLSIFRNVSAFKVRGTSLFASNNIGIGTLQPSSTLDIVSEGVASINLQSTNSNLSPNSNKNSYSNSRTKIYSYDDGNTYIQSSGDILFTDINSNILRNICFKKDGNVGILTKDPITTLDVNGTANFSSGITTGTLCVPTNGEQPILDTNLYNHLMLYEDFLGESLNSRPTMSENVIYSKYIGGTTGYLQLTTNEQSQLSFVYWNFNIGNAFTLTFDHYAGNENGSLLPGADEIAFMWGGNILGDGYNISFNEYRGSIELIYNDEIMAYYPVNNLDNAEWHTSTIIFYRNIIRVIYDGVQVLAHLDKSKDLSNKNYFGFKGRTGRNTNYHRIRNIRLSKFSEGLWTYQSNTCSNILYNYGNIGIGTSRASYKLDVSGNARITEGISTSSLSATNLCISNNTLSTIISNSITAANLISTNTNTSNLLATNITVQKLRITGDACTNDAPLIVYADINSEGNNYFYYNSHGNYGSTCDKRIKYNINQLDKNEALDFIMKMNPIEYSLKDSSNKMAGFIAQDILNIATNNIQKNMIDNWETYNESDPNSPMLGLSNQPILSYLVSAFQKSNLELSQKYSDISQKCVLIQDRLTNFDQTFNDLEQKFNNLEQKYTYLINKYSELERKYSNIDPK